MRCIVFENRVVVTSAKEIMCLPTYNYTFSSITRKVAGRVAVRTWEEGQPIIFWDIFSVFFYIVREGNIKFISFLVNSFDNGLQKN